MNREWAPPVFRRPCLRTPAPRATRKDIIARFGGNFRPHTTPRGAAHALSAPRTCSRTYATRRMCTRTLTRDTSSKLAPDRKNMSLELQIISPSSKNHVTGTPNFRRTDALFASCSPSPRHLGLGFRDAVIREREAAATLGRPTVATCGEYAYNWK